MLEVRNVHVTLDGVDRLRGVTLSAGPREIVGLVGPKGAGKTLLLDVVSGLCQPSAGTVRFDGTDITSEPAHWRAALGIGRTHEHAGLVPGSTVRENLLAAQHSEAGYTALAGAVGSPAAARVERRLSERADVVLERLGLGHVTDVRVLELAPLERKKVELAAVVAPHPRLVLLDEPGEGTHPAGTAALAASIRQLRDLFQATIVLSDRHVRLVLDTADRVYCLDGGRVVAEGAPRAIRRHRAVERALLGGRERR